MRVLPSALIVLVVTATACAEMQKVDFNPIQRDWSRTRSEARRNIEAGNYHAADRLLAEFARVHPNTREARESAFWRAAYMVDPGNTQGSLEAGIAALDAYLATEPEGWYRNEAAILKRTAVAAQGLVAGASTGWVPPPVVTVLESRDSAPELPRRSRDEEIAELRNQLAKTKAELAEANAELERIKKRLANPSPF